MKLSVFLFLSPCKERNGYWKQNEGNANSLRGNPYNRRDSRKKMVASMSFYRPRALDEWLSHYAHCHLCSTVKLKVNMKKYWRVAPSSSRGLNSISPWGAPPEQCQALLPKPCRVDSFPSFLNSLCNLTWKFKRKRWTFLKGKIKICIVELDRSVDCFTSCWHSHSLYGIAWLL